MWRSPAVGLGLALAACIEPSPMLACGELLCPAGELCAIHPQGPTCERPPVCGDGILAYEEACDGQDLGRRTCETEGFYAGALTCQACALDTSGCSGACGDQLVQSAAGEECDTAATNGCYDRGFDDGALACDASCRSQTTSCGRDGWQPFVAVGTPSTLVAASGMIAILDTNPALTTARLYSAGGMVALPGGGYTTVAAVQLPDGTAEGMAFFALDRIDLWELASQSWSTVTPPAFAANPVSAWAARLDGHVELYVITADAGSSGGSASNSGVWHAIDGAWTETSITLTAAPHFLPTANAAWPPILATYGSFYDWDPAAPSAPWVQRTCSISADIGGAGVDEQDRIWLQSGTQLNICDRTSGNHTLLNTIFSSATLPIVPNGLGGMDILKDNLLLRYGPSGTDNLVRMAIAAAPRATVLAVDHGLPYAAAPGDAVRVLTTGAWRPARDLAPNTSDPTVRFQPDGSVTYGCSLQLDWEGSWDDIGACLDRVALPASQFPNSVAIDPTGVLYELTVGDPVFWDTTPPEWPSPPVFATVWARAMPSGTPEMAAAGPQVFSYRNPDNSDLWIAEPTTLSLAKLDGLALADLYGIGAPAGASFDTILHHYDGTSWADAIDLGLQPHAIWVAPDGTVWLVGDETIVGYHPATGELETTTFPNAGFTSISGVASGDIVAAGIPSFDRQFSGLVRYDGHVWFEVRMPDRIAGILSLAMTPFGVFATAPDVDDPSQFRIENWLRAPH